MIEQATSKVSSYSAPDAADIPRLASGWLAVTRAIWIGMAFMTGVLFLTSLPGYARSFSGQLAHIAPQNQERLTAIFALLSGSTSLATALLSFGLAFLFYRRRFAETVAAGLSFYLLLYAVIMAGPLEYWSVYWLGDPALALRLQTGLLSMPTIGLLLIFPNGRFVPAWSRWLMLPLIPLSITLMLLPVQDPEAFVAAMSPLLIVLTAALIGTYGLGVYAQYYRYRYVATAIERQQTKWVVYGLALWLVYMLLSSIPYYYLETLAAAAPTPWWASLSVLGWFLSLSIVPLSLTFAITRHRLWDIDVLINRTLVYGVMTAAIVGLYALLVGGMAALVQTRANWLVASIATALVALLIQPLRTQLQRRVNQLLYGQRDQPLEVLAQLGQQLEDALLPEQLLPRLVASIAETLKLPYTAITIQHDEDEQTAASYGQPVHQVQSFPLVHQGYDIGHLQVAPRSPGASFMPAEAQLLDNIARQAGTAVHALQLTIDLRQARQQIISSREEERRRLRRDLHDGLGPSLAAILLKIGSARALLADRPEMTSQLLTTLEADIETTLADIRRIVYDLRPPALDQFGLVGALQAYAEACESDTLTVLLEAPKPLPPLPAAVEVAAYHISREGLTNVVRHAAARRCSLRLWIERDRSDTAQLFLSLRDDGRGFADAPGLGVGLAAMRERASELGGSCTITGTPGSGVQVLAKLPLGAEEQVSS